MYSYKFGEAQVGKARLEGVDASYKDLAEVCSNIRGQTSSDAVSLLEKASKGKYPIRYRKFARYLAHRKELGGKQGRYPVKAVKVVLGVLRSALASAKSKTLSEDLLVLHACANKKDVYPRLSPKGGKRSRSYLETSRVEIVVGERAPEKKQVQKAEPKEAKPQAQQKAPASRKPEPKPAAKPAAQQKAPQPKAQEAKPEKRQPPKAGAQKQKTEKPEKEGES